MTSWTGAFFNEGTLKSWKRWGHWALSRKIIEFFRLVFWFSEFPEIPNLLKNLKSVKKQSTFPLLNSHYLRQCCCWAVIVTADAVHKSMSSRQMAKRNTHFVRQLFCREEGRVLARVVSRRDDAILQVWTRVMTDTYPVQPYLHRIGAVQSALCPTSSF